MMQIINNTFGYSSEHNEKEQAVVKVVFPELWKLLPKNIWEECPRSDDDDQAIYDYVNKLMPLLLPLYKQYHYNTKRIKGNAYLDAPCKRKSQRTTFNLNAAIANCFEAENLHALAEPNLFLK